MVSAQRTGKGLMHTQGQQTALRFSSPSQADSFLSERLPSQAEADLLPGICPGALLPQGSAQLPPRGSAISRRPCPALSTEPVLSLGCACSSPHL